VNAGYYGYYPESQTKQEKEKFQVRIEGLVPLLVGALWGRPVDLWTDPGSKRMRGEKKTPTVHDG